MTSFLGVPVRVRDAIYALRELAGIVGFEVRSEFDGPVDSAISNEIAEHLLVTITSISTSPQGRTFVLRVPLRGHLLLPGGRQEEVAML